MPGFVSLVGAGPWSTELLTLGGRDRLARADVVICDYLVNPAHLVHCRADAQIFHRVRQDQPGAHLSQAEINHLIVEHALAGKRVVRLKGGDPMVFGRGPEEAAVCREHGIAYEFVAGVTAAIAAPEAAGIPVTHRDFTPCVSFVSGFEAYDKLGLHVDWEQLARSGGTLVLMMSVHNCRINADKLIAAGRSASTPAAVIRWGTRGIQRTLVGTLADIADQVEAARLRAPAVMVVGEVVREREHMQWLEHRPLFGRRIVLARALEAGGELAQRLADAGAEVVSLPVLELRPPADPAPLAACVRQLATWRGLILSSRAGVDAFVDALLAHTDLRALAGLRVLAIGSGTAAHCLARGLRPDLVPSVARSEGVVDCLRELGALRESWLHVRGDEGRDLLARAFAEAGGRLTTVIGYRLARARLPASLAHSLLPPASGGEGVDAVCVTSGRVARSLLAYLEEELGESEARAVLAAARIVALGPVTADALRELGFEAYAVAETPDDDALHAALRRALAAREESSSASLMRCRSFHRERRG